MITALKIYQIAAFIVYALLEGLWHAHLYHYKNISNVVKGLNLHPFFAVIRGVMVVSMSLVVHSWVFGIGLCLIFSFFHNSAFFEWRNRLDPKVYPKGWLDDSASSTALFDFTIHQRVGMLLLGAGVLTYDLLVFSL
jgi:hypothetical protein